MILGKNLVITSTGEGAAVLAASRSCRIEVEADLLETISPTSSSFRTYEPGVKDWTLSTGHLLLSGVKTKLLAVGQTYNITCQVVGAPTDTLSGTVICRRCTIDGQVGSLASGSFVFQGTGELV